MSILNRTETVDDDVTDQRPRGSITDPLVRRAVIPPLLPKDFLTERQGNGVRLKIIDIDRAANRNGAVQYVFGFARGVDTSTQTGRDAGAVRTEQCGQVAAPGTLDAAATTLITDARYQSGVFYCWGVDGLGNRSAGYLWSPALTNEILDSSIPGDFTHFDVSESGEESTPGIIDSVITVTGRAPNPLTSCDGLQLYLKDYTRLGVTDESEFRRYIGVSGGSLVFKVPYALVRRAGTGTINVTNANANVTVTSGSLLSEVQAGDQLELLGQRVTFNAPSDNTTVTLASNWPGPTGSFPIWKIVPLVTVFGVSISKGGTRRSDIENAPKKAVLFDGDISAPVAPTILSGTAMGNVNRIDVQQPIGTSLAVLHLWRATGADQAFASAVQIDSMELNPTLPTTASGVLRFPDTKFTLYEREIAQTFTYFCTVTNRRGDSSPASTSVNVSCRLDASQDVDPSIPSRDGFKNLLFDGFIGGTGTTVSGVNNVVTETDTTQDPFNFNPAIAPQTVANIGTGASRLRAWTRWGYRQTNQTTVFPIHANGNEVKFAPPGSGSVGSEKDVGIVQYLSGWNAANAIDKKLQKGQYVTVQILIYCDGGTTPNGSFFIGVAQYNGGSSQWALKRDRISDDSFQENSGVFIFSADKLAQFSASVPMKAYATFHLDSSVNTDKIAIVYGWTQGTTSNLYVREAMMNDGRELAPWTADMGNIDMYYPVATTGAGSPPDGKGDRTGIKVP